MSTPANIDFRVLDSEVIGLVQRRGGGKTVSALLTRQPRAPTSTGVTGGPPKDQVLSVNGSVRTAPAARRRLPAHLVHELAAERVDRGAHRLGVVSLRAVLAGGRTPGPHQALCGLRYRLRHREGQRTGRERAVGQEADQGVRTAGLFTQLPRDTRACSGARIRVEGAGVCVTGAPHHSCQGSPLTSVRCRGEGAGGCGDSRRSRRPGTARLGRPGGAMGRGQLAERLADRWPHGQQFNAACLHQQFRQVSSRPGQKDLAVPAFQ